MESQNVPNQIEIESFLIAKDQIKEYAEFQAKFLSELVRKFSMVQHSLEQQDLQIERYRNEISLLKYKLKKQSQVSNEDFEGKIQSLTQQIEQLQHKNRDLESQLEQKSIEAENNKKKIVLYMGPDGRFYKAFHDNAQWVQFLDKENECYREINARLEAENAALRNEVNLLELHISVQEEKHDAEIHQYEELLTESATSITEYEESVQTLRRQVQILEGKNQSKEIMYNSYKEKNGHSIIIEGIEEDLYPGEQKDIIISYIKDRIKNLEPNTRQYHICKSILEANPENGTREEIRRTLMEILRSPITVTKLSPELKQKLKSIGFEIVQNSINNQNHPKIVFKDRYSVAISNTPSDKRSGLNTATTILRIAL